jgi:hypothetical protein
MRRSLPRRRRASPQQSGHRPVLGAAAGAGGDRCRLPILEAFVHVNAGSELILRQLVGRLGRRVHLLTPTYSLFVENLLQAHSRAGVRVGYAIAPPEIADALNEGNEPIRWRTQARPPRSRRSRIWTVSSSACDQLKHWTRELAEGLTRLGVRDYPSESYFLLADFSALDGRWVADRLVEREILVKPLRDPRLGGHVDHDGDPGGERHRPRGAAHVLARRG